MIEIYTGQTNRINLSLTDVPDGAVVVVLYENDTVVLSSNASDDGEWFINIPANLATSQTTYRMTWTYAISGETYQGQDWVNVVTPYVTVQEIRDAHPNLSSKTDQELKTMESRVRHAIDAYCGQTFGIRRAKTIIVEGDEGDFVPVGARVLRLTAAKKNGLELTGAIEVHPATPWLIRMVPYFGGWRKADVSPGMEHYLLGGGTYELTGDFGWEFVPSAIRLASLLLIGAYFNDSAKYKDMGLAAVSFADWRMEFEGETSTSTGSAEADTLLAPYVAPGAALI